MRTPRSALVALAGITFGAAALRAQTYPRGDDPRDTLAAGLHDAGVALKGMRLVAHAPKAAPFDSIRGLTFVNSDLAFGGRYVYQGNFAGFTVWDVADPTHPAQAAVVQCITAQGDPSVLG